MKITFLGTGTSVGVPTMGCDCEVCRSKDPHDKRLRASALIETDKGTKIIIDCGPDFRQQYLKHDIGKFDAILFTHEHFDHAVGLNEIRPLGGAELYAEHRVLEAIRYNLPYIFCEHPYPGAPDFHLHEVHDDRPFMIGADKVIPIRAVHARLPVLGYRIGSLAYITDFSGISDGETEKLKGLDVLVMGALRLKPHPAHLSVPEALELVDRLRPKQTFFIHMSHDVGLHADVCEKLPENVTLSYDGLQYEWHDLCKKTNTDKNIITEYK